MGAESSSLQDFKIDESVTQSADKTWTLHSAKDTDGTKVSVFVYETSVKQSSGFMENAAKVFCQHAMCHQLLVHTA